MRNKVFFDYSDTIQSNFKDLKDVQTFSKICIDTYNDKLMGQTQAQGNEVIRTKILQLMNITNENPSELQIRKAFKKTAVREAVFEIIEETLENTLITGWGSDPWFSKYVESKSFNLGQKNEFYIPADNLILAVSKISGDHHQIERQRLNRGTTRSLQMFTYAAKCYMELTRFLMGVEDWNALIDAISRAFTVKLQKEIHDQVMSAVTTLPIPAKYNRKGLATEANKKNFKQLIADVKRATGAPSVVIMGTDVALGELTGFGNVNWASAEAKSDVYNLGRLGRFEGNEIAVLENPFEYNDEAHYLEDDKKVLIMPSNIDKFVKHYVEGTNVELEHSERGQNGDDTKDYEFQTIMGVETITRRRFGVWTFEA